MNFDITILGSNSASFAYGRHHTSQLVNHNQCLYLIDCGEGTQNQLVRYKVKIQRIGHIFISHLHGDHYLGLVGLISTMHLQGRTDELHIFAPSGLDEVITLQLRLSDTRLNYPITFHEVSTALAAPIYESENLIVSTIPLNHRVKCAGFLFKEKPKKRRIVMEALHRGYTNLHLNLLKKGEDIKDENGEIIYKNSDVTLPPKHSRIYAYCSDTRYDERIIPLVKGADLLYHESTFMTDMQQRAYETFHSTAAQAAQIAKMAEVGKLMLGHYSSRYKELEPLLAEAQEVFSNTILSIEGDTLSIEY